MPPLNAASIAAPLAHERRCSSLMHAAAGGASHAACSPGAHAVQARARCDDDGRVDDTARARASTSSRHRPLYSYSLYVYVWCSQWSGQQCQSYPRSQMCH